LNVGGHGEVRGATHGNRGIEYFPETEDFVAGILPILVRQWVQDTLGDESDGARGRYDEVVVEDAHESSKRAAPLETVSAD
jgi:hypothetical protein